MTCKKQIKFELLKDDKGQAIPKPGEFTKDGKQKYKYKPVNLDGSKHECAAAVFTAEKTETKDSTNSPKPGNSNPVTGDMFFAGIEQLIRELQSMKRELIAELRAGLRPAPVEYDESEGPI
jgi:hypothetical protein